MYPRKKCFSSGLQCFVVLATLCLESLFAQSQGAAPDSVVASVSAQYSNPSLVRQLLLGRNYRKEWETPVALPVLNLQALGLRVEGLGGGRQTKSLHLVDRDGAGWALRTIDKDVRPALPRLLRNRLFLSVVQDMVSAAHPFGPLVVAPLATAAGISNAVPTAYFVPDDPALGTYQSLFKGTVCLLEKRDVLGAAVKSKSTMRMLQDRFVRGERPVDQRAYLTARLLDMLIADWDRHQDQWKWAEVDSGGRGLFLPLPKDRDQAFFSSQGWLLHFIRLFAMKFTVGFTKETNNVVRLNRVAWSLDRLLLNELPEAAWQSLAQNFADRLPDTLLARAVYQLPSALYQLNGDRIAQKLVSRKRSLLEDALAYYRFLARKVVVCGSDTDDHFHLSGGADSLCLVVTHAGSGNVLYRRTFYPSQTKEIVLLGLGGDDRFESDLGVFSSIRLVIDGGPGTNSYHLGTEIRSKAHDSKLDAAAYLKSLRNPLRVRKEEEKDDGEAEGKLMVQHLP